MFRFIVPAILIGLSITLSFVFINPLYTGVNGITDLKAQIVSYNDALNNSKSLEAERDKLTQKYNSIDPANLIKLQKLLPDGVDNIRLVLEIEKLAAPYGMTLKDVKYDTISASSKNATDVVTTVKGGTEPVAKKSYGTWDLQFSTEGSYSNFLYFLRDLENNLRIVDVSSIDFSSDTGPGVNVTSTSSTPYKYNFSVKTYWLKN